MLRITADTNIFMSGLNFKGKPFELLELARAGGVEIAMSDAIMTEIKRVLRLKFKWPDEDIADVEREITRFTRRVEPTEKIDAVKTDLTDNRILECAVAAGSDYIVTGDNHLLTLGQFRNIPIVRVADFLGIQPGLAR